MSPGGAAIGTAQTPLLRNYVDDKLATAFVANPSATPPLLMKQLKGFGSASALVGIGAGAAALAGSLYTMKKGASPGISEGLLAYGATALTGGVISGALPTTAWSAGIAADPAFAGSARALAGGVRVLPAPRRTVTVGPAGFITPGISGPTSNQIAASTLF